MQFGFNPLTHKLDLLDVVAIPPGTVASLTGNSGGSVAPDGGGNINIVGGTGVTVVGTPGTNTLTLNISGATVGTGTTTDGVTPLNLLTIPLGATPGVYLFRVDITGFDATTPAGVAYFLTSGFRTTGAAAVEMGSYQTTDDFEDAALVGVFVDIFASGNNALLQIYGLPGKTINWKAVLTYTFGS
jgi:hypothetical protein